MTARRRGGVEYRMIAAPGDCRSTLLPARHLCAAEGFVMVRRPGVSTVPFIITENEWAQAPLRGKGAHDVG